MTTSRPSRLIDHMRGVRYGEVLAVFDREGRLEAEVYGTQLLNDCPAELWDTLVADDIAGEMGALYVKLNGPRHWVLDGLGAKVAPVEPVLREFNGLLTRRITLVDLGQAPGSAPYTERRVDRGAQFFWDAGKPVYELVATDGTVYTMQALCIGVDPTMNDVGALDSLGSRLQLPAGWTYRIRHSDEELICDTTDEMARVLQDEFENTYTVI